MPTPHGLSVTSRAASGAACVESFELKEVQQRWGEQYMQASVDGLELEDCEETQGKQLLL